MKYIEEKRLTDIARAFTDEDAMVVLRVLLIEKGLYPKFIEGKSPSEINAIVNPSDENMIISPDTIDEITSKIRESISCMSCPFYMAKECEGLNTPRSECIKHWEDWFRTSFRGI